MIGQNQSVMIALALVCALASVGCGPGDRATPTLRGGRLDPPTLAADFTLTDHNGKPFTLSSTRGKVTLLYFGYTSCPDVCPLTLADMAGALQDLGADAQAAQIVFITLDPERDSRQTLQKYVTAFDATNIGLHGTSDEIKQVADAYGVKYKKAPLANSALGYAVDHSAFIYVIDRRGQLRELLPFGTSRQSIASDLKFLINEGDSS